MTVLNTLVERIKINRAWKEERGGRTYYLKERRPGARAVGMLANAFFALAGAPIRLFTDPKGWQQWEVGSFHGLHGEEGFRAFSEGTQATAVEVLPGINLTDPLDDGTITPAMTFAAGRELKRAHAWQSSITGISWSHADPHAGNFIYDASAGRARIIDFEVVHVGALAATERQIDDLFVFLQDIEGRIPDAQWVPCAHAFLQGYDDPAKTAAAVAKLASSASGSAYLWHRIRTSFLPARELKARTDALVAHWGSKAGSSY